MCRRRGSSTSPAAGTFFAKVAATWCPPPQSARPIIAPMAQSSSASPGATQSWRQDTVCFAMLTTSPACSHHPSAALMCGVAGSWCKCKGCGVCALPLSPPQRHNASLPRNLLSEATKSLYKPHVRLRGGALMPAIGLGTGWAGGDPQSVELAVRTWLRVGGRLIDAAEHCVPPRARMADQQTPGSSATHTFEPRPRQTARTSRLAVRLRRVVCPAPSSG